MLKKIFIVNYLRLVHGQQLGIAGLNTLNKSIFSSILTAGPRFIQLKICLTKIRILSERVIKIKLQCECC